MDANEWIRFIEKLVSSLELSMITIQRDGKRMGAVPNNVREVMDTEVSTVRAEFLGRRGKVDGLEEGISGRPRP